LKIPILGGILGKTAIARFTRTLGTLISAGVPILDALNITKETCGNEVYSRALAKVHDAIREGESMADPLRPPRSATRSWSTWWTWAKRPATSTRC